MPGDKRCNVFAAKIGHHRPDAELVLPSELLEQIHLGFPIRSKPPRIIQEDRRLRDGRWAKFQQHIWANIR